MRSSSALTAGAAALSAAACPCPSRPRSRCATPAPRSRTRSEPSSSDLIRSRSSAARSKSRSSAAARICSRSFFTSPRSSSALNSRSAAFEHGHVVGLVQAVGQRRDRALDGLRGDAVLQVVLALRFAAAAGLVHRVAHRVGLLVRVQEHRPAHVARGAAHGLDQRAGGAQEAFLVGVEDRDERDLRQVQALAQQVDPDQHVEVAVAQVAQDLGALDRRDLRVQVAHADADVLVVARQLLGHALGQGRDEHAVARRDARADLAEEILDLVLGGPHLDRGIHQTRRAG